MNVKCEGSGAKKASHIRTVICCCGDRIAVVKGVIPDHVRTGPIVNGESYETAIGTSNA
jgi:hypothetical protein